MSTVHTCITTEEGWGLYSHFLSNYLLVIRGATENSGEENEDTKNRRERIVHDNWAQLAGNLYMIMRRMKLNGHDDVAAKMQQIIDMVVEQNLANPETHEAIHAKHKELNPAVQEFEDALKELKAKHAQQ